MNTNMKKVMAAAVLSVAVVGGTLTTTTPAQATHKLGHAILGGVIGGVIGSAIINGANRRRPVYSAPAPVYVAPAPHHAPVYAGLPQQHYNWCYNKYRSYHQASNTYQPYGGYPRTQCRSPWWR
jgi:hypothetical protein